MKLVTASGITFLVHFHHEQVDERLWNWITTATIHQGPCKEKKRPCDTEGAVVGIARSSRKDPFNKAKGRKLALGRAVHAYARAVRAELWAEYLKLYPPEKAK